MTPVENVTSRSDLPAQSPVGQITGSKAPVTLLITASGFLVLGSVLAGLAHALLATTSSSSSESLLTAGAWLMFVAAAGALAAVCAAGWRLIVEQSWLGVAVLAPVAVSSLLVAIGFLVAASALPHSNGESGLVVAAIGLGGLMLQALVNAARCSIQEQRRP